MGIKNRKTCLWIIWIPAVILTLALAGFVIKGTGPARDSLIIALIGSMITTGFGLVPLLFMGRPWIRGFARAIRTATTARLTMIIVVSVILGISMELNWRWFLGWMGLIHLMFMVLETILLMVLMNRCNWTVQSLGKTDEYVVSAGEEYGS
jgi:hypothetical protein